MMQQAQLPTLAVLGGTGPEAGKKNSISRAAEAGLSDPCTALKVLSGEAKKKTDYQCESWCFFFPWDKETHVFIRVAKT